MLETYTYLDQEDKNKLVKLAMSKMLSLSTLIDIICNNYYYTLSNKEFDEQTKYIHKGDLPIHIHIRAKLHENITSPQITNCVYKYLHADKTKNNLKNLDRKIQSECDKTLDPNYLKNTIIRLTYHERKSKK